MNFNVANANFNAANADYDVANMNLNFGGYLTP